jgi:hypothetical protein
MTEHPDEHAALDDLHDPHEPHDPTDPAQQTDQPQDEGDPQPTPVASAALAQSFASGRGQAQAIAEMCLIAGQSQRTAEFLAAGFSEAQVRRALLDARADQPEIASRITADARHQPAPGKQSRGRCRQETHRQGVSHDRHCTTADAGRPAQVRSAESLLARNRYRRRRAKPRAGHRVGRDTTSTKLKAFDPDATDGSEIAIGVLAGDVDATLIDRDDALVIARHAIVARGALVWPTGISARAESRRHRPAHLLGRAGARQRLTPS